MTPAPGFRARALRVLALAVGLVVLAEGCAPTADGAGVDKKAIKRANKLAAGGGKKGAGKRRLIVSASGNKVGNDSAAAAVPFVNRAGYVVRGTDILMFHPCSDTTRYFVVAGGGAMQRIIQRYKFSVQHPYVPMYIDLQVRFLKDTVTAGDFTFTRIAEVRDVNLEEGKPKACRPPSRSALLADAHGR